MKALCWFGKEDVRVEDVPDPHIINPRDAIVKITRTCICGSDLHLYDAMIPTLEAGDILGHEFMGEVVEVGPEVKNLRPGDRVIVPFTIACGNCFYCKQQLWSLCDNSNPNAYIAEKIMGYSPSGLFGYTHMMGGYAGGQAQFARVPFADVGPLKIDGDIADDKVVFLSDIFPTGYMAAEHCDIKPGDVIAVWGCGPVGIFAIQSAYLLGAERVIAIDRFPDRLQLAARAKAEVLNYEELGGTLQLLETLREMTGGRGPDACIDAVGMEAHGPGIQYFYDRVKQAAMMETDRPIALRECILACRKGGIVSIPGVYGGLLDKVPMGAAMNKGLTFKTGQTHMMRYMKPLYERIQRGEVDTTLVISHRLPLEEAPRAYKMFRDKQEHCTKVVLDPWAERRAA